MRDPADLTPKPLSLNAGIEIADRVRDDFMCPDYNGLYLFAV